MRHLLLGALVAFAIGCGKKDDTASGGGAPAGDQKPATPAEPTGYPNRVSGLKQPATRDGVRVELRGARLLNKEHMIVTVRVASTNESKVVSFKGWDGKQAKAVDSKGNALPHLPIGPQLQSDFQKAIKEKFGDDAGFGSGAAYHDRPRFVILGFNKPAAIAEYVDIDLDGESVGTRNPFLFRIPNPAWEAAD